MKALRRLVAKLKGAPRLPEWAPDRVQATWRGVQEQRLTYLGIEKVTSLLRLCLDAEARGEAGAIVEAGCALGGSSILLCSAKSRGRPLRVYDVFGMIPPPGEKDGADVHERYDVIKEGKSRGIRGDEYYGYKENLYEQVRDNFTRLGFAPEEHSVELVRGLVQDTLTGSDPVVLAHIDVDWYDPVMTCLERLTPRLATHGAIVLDDYQDWSGCRKAVTEYFERVGREAFSFDESAGHLVVRRAAR